MKSFSFRQKFFNNSTSEEVRVEPLTGLGRSLWVIGRSLCLFKVFYIPADVKDKNVALSLQIQQWSHFANTGEYVVWQNGSALVWIWDETLRLKLVAPLGAEQAMVVIEELLFISSPKSGVRLVPCAIGVVAEYWHDGVLRDSQWWLGLPSKEQLLQFYRTNDLPIPADLPVPTDVALLDKPWGIAAVNHGTSVLRYEQFISPFMVLLLLILGYQAVSLFKWTGFEQQLQIQTEQLTLQVEPILTARQQAYEQRTVIGEFNKLAEYPAQLHLWAVIVRKMTSLDSTIKAWKFYNGTLELTVSGAELDPEKLIRIFSQDEMFTEITTINSRKPGELRLKMTVVKNSDQVTRVVE